MVRLFRLFVIAAAIGALYSMVSLPAAVAGEDPAYLTIGAGTWETLRSQLTDSVVDVTFKSDYRMWFLKPQVGALFAGDGDYYVYSGLRSDLYFGKHFVLTPSLSIGYYGGAGFNLGSHFEFREELEAAYRFDNTYRLGLSFSHISNAGVTDRNPGSEIAALKLSVPLGAMFSREELAKARAPKVAMTRFNDNQPQRQLLPAMP